MFVEETCEKMARPTATQVYKLSINGPRHSNLINSHFLKKLNPSSWEFIRPMN